MRSPTTCARPWGRSRTSWATWSRGRPLAPRAARNRRAVEGGDGVAKVATAGRCEHDLEEGTSVSDFLNLRDRVIVITGGASGMGRAIAQAASAEGARLVLSDFDGERLAATAVELKGEVHHLRADVTKPADIDAVLAL